MLKDITETDSSAASEDTEIVSAVRQNARESNGFFITGKMAEK